MGTWKLIIVADDRLDELYVDGVKSAISPGDQDTVQQVDIPANTRVIAIKASDVYGGVAGVLACVHGDDWLAFTGASWKCATHVGGDNWTNTTFDDSSWPNAVAWTENKASGIKGTRAGILDSASWIWTKNYQGANIDKTVFCRVHLPLSSVPPLRKLADEEIQPGTPTLLRIISSLNGSPVSSMAIHGNLLFVGIAIGYGGVKVYDTTTFSFQRKLSIAGLGERVSGLATCDVNNCLYVSDLMNSSVHKVDLSTYNVRLKWSVDCNSSTLSVNAARNVLVTNWFKGKIKEYTPVGSLVREVCLGSGIEPNNAIQLPSGELLVSHRGHRVITVGLDGKVTRSYGNTRGSQPGQLDSPRGIAVSTKQGYILVADKCNNRIMLLNPSLSDARQLPLSVDGGLAYPSSIILDESRGRLYVSEYGNEAYQQRVMVFDNVINIDAMFKLQLPRYPAYHVYYLKDSMPVTR